MSNPLVQNLPDTVHPKPSELGSYNFVGGLQALNMDTDWQLQTGAWPEWIQRQRYNSEEIRVTVLKMGYFLELDSDCMVFLSVHLISM